METVAQVSAPDSYYESQLIFTWIFLIEEGADHTGRKEAGQAEASMGMCLFQCTVHFLLISVSSGERLQGWGQSRCYYRRYYKGVHSGRWIRSSHGCSRDRLRLLCK